MYLKGLTCTPWNINNTKLSRKSFTNCFSKKIIKNKQTKQNLTIIATLKSGIGHIYCFSATLFLQTSIHFPSLMLTLSNTIASYSPELFFFRICSFLGIFFCFLFNLFIVGVSVTCTKLMYFPWPTIILKSFRFYQVGRNLVRY